MELSRDELDALVGAYALDALEPDERDEFDRLLQHDTELVDQVRRFQEAAVGLLAASVDTTPAPTGLRVGVLQRAVDARHPGRHVANPLGSDLAPAELWRRQFADLAALLVELAGPDWQANTSFDRPVHELLAHLSAVLDQFAAEIGIGSFEIPPGSAIDHWGITEPRIAEMLAQPADGLVARLLAIGAPVEARLAAATPDEFDAPRPTVGLTLGDRTRQLCFELWMHTDDVRRATGRSMVDPDPERVCTLCDLSARFLGLGMMVVGRDHPGQRARLVLTGPGGGTWLTALSLEETPEGGEDAVVVVADAVAYCRMVGRLLEVDELPVEVEGDADLALDLLTGAASFAV